MSKKTEGSPPDEPPVADGRTTNPFWKLRIDDLEGATNDTGLTDLSGDPYYNLINEMEARRSEEDRAIGLLQGDEALGRLRLLRRRAMEFAASFPNLRDYEWFMRNTIIPEYNELFSDQHLCAECGGVFFLRGGDTTFCSPECRARAADR